MSRYLLLLIVLCSTAGFGQLTEQKKDQESWNGCYRLYGRDAVRLKIEETHTDLWTNKIWTSQYDSWFENAQKCADAYTKQFGSYPSTTNGNRIDISIIYHCVSCEQHAKLVATKQSPKPGGPPQYSNPGLSQNTVPSSRINPVNAALVGTVSNALNNSGEAAMAAKNQANEQNSYKFPGGRPSAENAYNLQALDERNNNEVDNEKSKSAQRETERAAFDQSTKTNQNNEPKEKDEFEFNVEIGSKLAEVIETLKDELYDKEKPLADRSLKEQFFSDAADITLKGLEHGSDALDLYRFFKDPHDNEKATKAVNVLGSYAAGELSSVTGMFYDKGIAPIPSLMNNTMGSVVDQLVSLEETGEYNEAEVYRATGNYLGGWLGFGNTGDRVIDYKKEGTKSWRQLTKEHGLLEGSKKSVWYYLLNDFQEKTQQINP